MILLTEHWRKKPSTTQTSAKNSPNSQKQKLQCESAATSLEQGKGQGTSYKTIQEGLQNPKYSSGCHGEFVSDGQNHDGTTEKGGSQIKISEIISDVLDCIPNLYLAINDMKSHISDKNSSIWNNLKTNNLSLSQIDEIIMFFEKFLRIIKSSSNNSSFENKINEQSALIKELADKYFKFNIYDIIQTRPKQAISIIKSDNKKVLGDISN
ncbi:hypothetical protein O181_096352 [Austropuccinia psidii MF-1]|uniref:Uncharacterized protein n=1 Tax=Austropuccinia psidii MF-1 TaxID=1389203 RepID=A0A9Q3J738_9BASI|nr:hypothetical protein [Austropuccinia psidii MF-1]